VTEKARQPKATLSDEGVVQLLRSYNDVMILAEPLLMELWQSAGLTFAQIRALRWLRASGPMSARELSDMTHIPGPSLTRLLTTLEDDGLVGRKIDLRDRRRIVVAITRRGRRVLGEHNNILGKSIFAVAALALAPEVREALTDNLQQFREALDRASLEVTDLNGVTADENQA
jgi:DNA-binding MarR family transcriptional regulator